MKPRVTVITLGVDDLERAVKFYSEGLGFPTEGIVRRKFDSGAVAFFDMQPGLRLALWPRKRRLTLSCPKRRLPGRISSSRPRTRSGVAMKVTSRIQTNTYGRLSGTRNGSSECADA